MVHHGTLFRRIPNALSLSGAGRSRSSSHRRRWVIDIAARQRSSRASTTCGMFTIASGLTGCFRSCQNKEKEVITSVRVQLPKGNCHPRIKSIAESAPEERPKRNTHLGRNYTQRFLKRNETDCPFRTQSSMLSFSVFPAVVGHLTVVR